MHELGPINPPGTYRRGPAAATRRLARRRQCDATIRPAIRPPWGSADEAQHRPHPDHPCRQPAAAARSAGVSRGARERPRRSSRRRSTRASPRRSTRSSRSRSRPGSTASATASRARSPTPSTSATASPASARSGRRPPTSRRRPRPHRDIARPSRFSPAAAARTRGGSWFSRAAVPCCTGPVAYDDRRPLDTDLANLAAACAAAKPVEAFMNAASPGVLTKFVPDRYYQDEDAYVEALAECAEGGIRGDPPGRLHPADRRARSRLGPAQPVPAPLRRRVPAHRRAQHRGASTTPPPTSRPRRCACISAGAITRGRTPTTSRSPRCSTCACGRGRRGCRSRRPTRATRTNGRICAAAKIPDDKVLIPGVLNSTTNFVEHPRLIAQRICNVAEHRRARAGHRRRRLRLCHLRRARTRWRRRSSGPSSPRSPKARASPATGCGARGRAHHAPWSRRADADNTPRMARWQGSQWGRTAMRIRAPRRARGRGRSRRRDGGLRWRGSGRDRGDAVDRPAQPLRGRGQVRPVARGASVGRGDRRRTRSRRQEHLGVRALRRQLPRPPICRRCCISTRRAS